MGDSGCGFELRGAVSAAVQMPLHVTRASARVSSRKVQVFARHVRQGSRLAYCKPGHQISNSGGKSVFETLPAQSQKSWGGTASQHAA